MGAFQGQGRGGKKVVKPGWPEMGRERQESELAWCDLVTRRDCADGDDGRFVKWTASRVHHESLHQESFAHLSSS